MENDKNKTGNTKKNFTGVMKRTLMAGIAAIFPLFITIYLIVLIFRFADNSVGKYINDFLANQFNLKIPGIGLIVLLFILLLVGFLSRMFIGRWLAWSVDKLFQKTPLIANIYPSAKKLSDFLFSEEQAKEKFRKVVLVEFPTQDTWSVGFITNEKLEDFSEALSDEFVCVFVPLAPASFSGFVYWARRDKVKKLNISVDKAIKFVLSGGVLTE
ncbi:MAG: DUF502 domain-containing protein [Candidatus Omnitrophica bacterium]|nr:DUF502 domain-containing protein [Candidatus Omnitrophota bacterium]